MRIDDSDPPSVLCPFDSQRYTALLNFWHQLKRVREDYLNVQEQRTKAGDMTASEAMEQVHRLLEEYETLINPPALLEYKE